MRSWTSDLIVTLSALIVAGSFGYLYYHDINQQIAAKGQKPVGTVIYKQHEAQRRFNDRVVWQPVSANTALYNLDSVRTVRGSEAVIRLIDGTKIVMQPNTLITLDWTGKAKSVNFLSGSITAIRTKSVGGTSSAPAGVVIKSGKSQVTIDQATVNLTSSAGGKLAVAVSGGTASLLSGGSVRNLSTSDVANVDTSTGAANVSAVKLLPTAPAQNAIYVEQGADSPIPFTWDSSMKLPRYTLQLSSSSDFKTSVRSVGVTGRTADVALTPGTHYWRIAGGGRTSPAEQVTVLHDTSVSLLGPQRGSVYTFNTASPLVPFSWSASKIASGYELQIARDSEFTNLVDQTHTTTNGIAIGTLSAGNYYWRVKPLYDFSAASNVSVSKVSSFRIIQAKTLKPAGLVSPAAKAVLNAVAIQSTGVLFNWRPDDTIEGWSFTIARKSDMSDVVAHVKTSDNYYLMRKTLHPGRYFWQVRGTTANGVAAPPSPVRSLSASLENAKITLRSPRPSWNYDGATVGNLPVVWASAVKGNFEVDLSTTADFSSNLTKLETTFDNAHFGNLPPATYYWRVRLLARDGSTLMSSKEGTFTVLQPLLPPRPISPSAGQVLSLVNPKSLDFRWDGDPRSRYYDFTLYRSEPNGSKRKIATTTNLTENQYSLKDFSSLSVGDYTWIVAAHNPKGPNTSAQSTLPVSASFTIGRLRIVGAPALGSPADGATLGGVAALDRGVDFSWHSPGRNATAVLQIATDSSFTRVVHRVAVGAGVESVHLPQLLPGRYYWRIQARTADNIQAPVSPTYALTVSPLPRLPEPQTVTPAQGGTVNM